MARHLLQRIVITRLLRSHPTSVLPHHPTGCIFFCDFVSQKKLVQRDVRMSDHTGDVSNYDDYRVNHKPIIQVMVQTIKEILDTTTAETNKIIVANPQLKKRSRANVLNNYYDLLEAGVQKATIMENIWLLAHENNKLKDKLGCISKLNMNNDELIPWLRMTLSELTNFIFYTQNDMDSYTHNKIEHLTRRLECSIQELCELTIRCSFLLKIPISHIDRKLDILHEYNINNKSILNDLWIFRYSENHIRYRCELYKDTQCLEIKTWALRCPLRIITRTIQRNHVERGLLRHHKSVSEYLVNKLQVNEEALRVATTKWPSILRVNLAKLDQLINMLHQNGIPSNEILQHGQIFYFNIETLQDRIKKLKGDGLYPKLSMLKLTEKAFNRTLRRNNIEQELLQHYGNVKNYLMNKLNIDEKTLENASEKWPNILRVNIQKMDQLINLLQQNGIMSDEILGHGRIFGFSTDTLRKRIKMLNQLNIAPKVTVITYDKKSFDRYIMLRKSEKE